MQDLDEISALERARVDYEPPLPELLAQSVDALTFDEVGGAVAGDGAAPIKERFPHTFGRPTLRLAPGSGIVPRPRRVGVVLSGGQAPGGHNVIAGLFDVLSALGQGSQLIGFRGGPRGIVEGRTLELDRQTLRPYRNSGGFDLLGSGRDKIESERQLVAAHKTCRKLELDGLVVIGGDDSNTNAAVLAEYMLDQGDTMSVIGVPKTIDGDMKGHGVEASFGFDTATRVYSELIGNICRDARSAGKYWHFVKLMGRSASHVTLECALQTRPNLALIGEEIERRGLTLNAVVESLADAVRRRAAAGLSYGVCLVPEGLIEFVPEVRDLIDELNAIVSPAVEFDRLGGIEEKHAFVVGRLSPSARQVFDSVPQSIQAQLLLDRDSHGNVQVSKIDTEQLLIAKVSQRIERWRAVDEFPGKFAMQGHFFGYEGRCSAPTNFDAAYTNALGRLAALLVADGRTGYLCGMSGLVGSAESWQPTGIPLTSMMQMETRKGKPTPVIGKALVDLDGAPFRAFAEQRERWLAEDRYRYPGAIQYFGPTAVCAAPSLTLGLEAGEPIR